MSKEKKEERGKSHTGVQHAKVAAASGQKVTNKESLYKDSGRQLQTPKQPTETKQRASRNPQAAHRIQTEGQLQPPTSPQKPNKEIKQRNQTKKSSKEIKQKNPTKKSNKESKQRNQTKKSSKEIKQGKQRKKSNKEIKQRNQHIHIHICI